MQILYGLAICQYSLELAMHKMQIDLSIKKFFLITRHEVKEHISVRKSYLISIQVMGALLTRSQNSMLYPEKLGHSYMIVLYIYLITEYIKTGFIWGVIPIKVNITIQGCTDLRGCMDCGLDQLPEISEKIQFKQHNSSFA